jgi:hypothetical protein
VVVHTAELALCSKSSQHTSFCFLSSVLLSSAILFHAFLSTSLPVLHVASPSTGCGKLTSFFEYEMPYEKGS